MTIQWPDQDYTLILNPAIDSVYKISQVGSAGGETKTTFESPTPAPAVYFDSIVSNFDRHKEDDYIDFYYERNTLELLSREGPKAATGDVNGDGYADIYIGGTAGHPGQLYLQTASGAFEKKQDAIFSQFIEFEDEAVLFLMQTAMATWTCL